jgi:hypothetical protein
MANLPLAPFQVSSFRSHPSFSLYPQKAHAGVGAFEVGVFAEFRGGGDHLK